jgi:hypothetical protein
MQQLKANWSILVFIFIQLLSLWTMRDMINELRIELREQRVKIERCEDGISENKRLREKLTDKVDCHISDVNVHVTPKHSEVVK